MFQRLMFSCVLAALAAAPLTAQDPRCISRPVVLAADTIEADINHPKFLVRVEEVDETKRRPVLVMDTSRSLAPRRQAVFEHVNHAVDRDNKIDISFNRGWLMTRDPAAEVLITGRVITGDGTIHNIEIPGYSVVGQQSRVASTRVRSSRELASLLQEFAGVWCAINRRLRSVEDQASQTNAALKAVIDAQRRREQLLSELNRVRGDSARVQSQLASYSDSLAVVTDPASNQRFHQRITDLTGDSDRITMDLNTRFNTYVASEGKVRELEAEGKHLEALRTGYVREARQLLLAQRPALEEAINSLNSAEDSTLLDVLALRIGRHPRVLARRADQIRTNWYPRLADTTTDLNVWLNAIQNIRDGLDDIGGSIIEVVANNDRIFAPDLVSRLKDTQFSVAQTGAKAGDRVVLRFENRADRSPLPRTLELILPVTEYGLLRDLTDSFLLVKRRHADARRDSLGLQAARRQILLDSLPREIRVAEDVEYDPAPSITFGWVYNHRPCYRNCAVSSFFHRTLHWLRPGLGLNVSFPDFETRYVQLSIDSTGVQEKTTDYDKTINLGVGIVGSLFGNSLVAGWGRHLTSEDPDSYFMVGFSFVQVVEGVLKAVKP